LRVILHSQEVKSVDYTFEILESSTAVKDIHYTVDAFSGTINTNSVIDTLPIKIISSNLIPCEIVTLDLKLISSSVERVSTGTLSVNLNLESASELAGIVTYLHSDNFVGSDLSGTVTITALQTPGDYILSDFSFGAWPEAYGIEPPSGTLKWSNICSKISLSGTDNYGDIWKMDEVISSGGPDFTFTWSNTYGEYGKVTLTREDGGSWPTLTL